MRNVRDDPLPGGFSTVDEKGRVALSKSVRASLGLAPGSQVAQVVIDGGVLIIPQDDHLARLSRDAQQALAAAGLSVQDILDELPAIKRELFVEAYGEQFLREVETLIANHGASPANDLASGA